MKNTRYTIRFFIICIFAISVVAFLSIKSIKVFWILNIILGVLCFVVILGLLFKDNRDPRSKLSWIFVLIFLPVMGIIFYWFFGGSPNKQRFFKKQRQDQDDLMQSVRSSYTLPQIDRSEQTASMEKIVNQTQFPVMTGVSLDFFNSGQALFEDIIETLKEAKHHVHIFYYIFKKDATGKKLRDALIDCCHRGVEVRFVFDTIGSYNIPYRFLKPLIAAGAQVEPYESIEKLIFSRTANLRNHRKLVIIDGQIGYSGGMNVGDEYRGISKRFRIWRDMHFKIEGLAVAKMQEAFVYDWQYAHDYKKMKDDTTIEDRVERYFSPKPVGNDKLQVIYSGPYDAERVMRDTMLNLMSSAEKSIAIVSPYCIPDEASLALVRRLAMTGIQVSVILPGKPENLIVYHGSNYYIEKLMSAGVKVYRYLPDSFIHSKYIIVDGKIGLIGTANFDIRSFYLNHEIAVVVYGEDKVMAKLNAFYEEDISNSTLYTQEDLDNRSLFIRMLETFTNLFSRLL